MKRMVVCMALVLSAAALPCGCGGAGTVSSGAAASPSASVPAAEPVVASSAEPAAPSAGPVVAGAVSDREGPSWNGRLGDTVRVDWYDQTSGVSHGELVCVVAVKRLPTADDDAPNEFGDDYGPYEWKYGVKVRLTSLDEVTARTPVAYQFLALSDGSHTETGVSGLGPPTGPDPSRVGRASTGWLTVRAEQGFAPTAVLLPVGAWRARWALD